VTSTLVRLEVDPNTVRPGWVALLVVLALAAATFLLWRNMGKQLKKIDFDEDRDSAPPEPDSPDRDPLSETRRDDVSPDREGQPKLPEDRPDRRGIPD
jgi:hypothetical protein